MSLDNTPENLDPVGPEETPVNTEDDYKEAGSQDNGLKRTELLAKIYRRYAEGVGAFEENRRMHSEDLNFVYNSEAMGQWDPVVLESRRGKPCYTFNRVIGPVNLVIADMRQTRPSVKVRPTSESASHAVADILEGLWRNIEEESRANTIYKNQYKFAVAGGYGALRLVPEYVSESSFDQILRIKDIPNPQTVIWDPECSDACAGDAMWCMIGERVSKEKYRSMFPDAEDTVGVTFPISRDSYGWFTDKEIRIVEYMEKCPYKKTIALLDNGNVVDYDPAIEAHMEGVAGAPKIIKKREVLKWRVMWVKCDGGQILEGPIFYNWERIPVVRMPGRYINIEGRKKLQSLVRHSKDAQRSYNSRCSDMIERSALMPKAPYLVTEKMVKGYEQQWAQANTSPRPYLPYNIDDKAEGGMPFRVAALDVPQGAIALAQQAQNDIQATIGYFDPALGNAEDMNRVSGKALVQHTRRSDLSSFEFIDGFGDALQLLCEMAINMIPTIYDTERVERIVGRDDVEKMVTVNQQTDDNQVINDLKEGSYGCTVTIGPSYQTARQETLQTLIDAAHTIPLVAQFAPDLIAKNIDTPDSDELTRRLRIPLIMQGIIKPTDEEKGNLPPPPQPDPLKVAELQREQALAQRDSAQAQITSAKAQDLDLEHNKLIYGVAGEHLNNMVMAQKLGQNQTESALQAEGMAQENWQQQLEGQQQLQQTEEEHQAAMQQQGQQADMDRQQQAAQHQQDMAHAEAMFHQSRTHAEHLHAQKLTHTEELNKQKVEHAKKLAATKPKPASSAAKKT